MCWSCAQLADITGTLYYQSVPSCPSETFSEARLACVRRQYFPIHAFSRFDIHSTHRAQILKFVDLIIGTVQLVTMERLKQWKHLSILLPVELAVVYSRETCPLLSLSQKLGGKYDQNTYDLTHNISSSCSIYLNIIICYNNDDRTASAKG